MRKLLTDKILLRSKFNSYWKNKIKNISNASENRILKSGRRETYCLNYATKKENNSFPLDGSESLLIK